MRYTWHNDSWLPDDVTMFIDKIKIADGKLEEYRVYTERLEAQIVELEDKLQLAVGIAKSSLEMAIMSSETQDVVGYVQQERVLELEKALEFYADEANWVLTAVGDDGSNAIDDEGDIAIAALKGGN